MKYERLTLCMAVQLAAPHTWPASVLPALFGILYSLYRGERMTLLMAAVLFVICVLMQSGVNTINDYFDYVKGTDSSDDCLEVSDAVLVYHQICPSAVLLLGMGFLGTAACLGLWVIASAGFAPLIVGVIGGLAVVGYSGGPLPLSYMPVGELASGVIMGGFIPLGIFAAASGRLAWEILLPALPFILGVGLIMMSNNGCDIEKDREAGRRTLPALLGRERTKLVFQAAVLIWITAVCSGSLFLCGPAGLAAPLILGIFGRRSFGYLLHAPLTQNERICQMKHVLKANMAGNGAYVLALALAVLKGG